MYFIRNRPYTPGEVEFIKDNYKRYSDLQIANKLRRPEYSVATKRLEIGAIRRIGNKKPEPIETATVESLQEEIAALVYFIETTNYSTWREIAITRKEQLLTFLKQF